MAFELLPHFFFTLDDGARLRYAQFAPPETPRGTVLVLPGRREFIEKKYGEVAQPLLERGFRVIVVEPRGQGLSSRVLEGEAKQRDHIDDFAIHLNDLRAFYRAVVLPGLTEPLLVNGHSMGGHLILRWLAEDHPAVAGAIVTAPMIALTGMAAQMATYGLSWASVKLFSHETAYAPTQHDYGSDDLIYANNPLTSDEERFKVIQNYFEAQPDLAVGGVTWGWILAALRSMNETHTWPYLAHIDIPVLALVGEHDMVTPAQEISPFLNQIPRVRTHIIARARHDLLNEADEARTEAWRQIDEFLKLVVVA